MEKSKKLLVIAPAVILGSSVAGNGNSQGLIDTPQAETKRPVFATKWLSKIIDYYYTKLEEDITEISSKQTILSGVSAASEIKANTLKSKIEKVYKLIHEECKDYISTIRPNNFIFPIDKKDFITHKNPITSFYGPRSWIIARGIFHNGIDIAAAGGTGVLSPLPGYIVYARRESSGNLYTVMIYHGRGMYSRWAHVNPVKGRGYVAPGEVFARVMYKSRKSTGPHIHMEFLKRAEDGFYTINPFAQKYGFNFNITKSGTRLEKFENYYENLKFKQEYKWFNNRAARLIRRIFNKRYKEYEKNKVPVFEVKFKNVIIKEKSLENIILLKTKKVLQKRIVKKLLADFNEMTLSPDFVKYFAASVFKVSSLSFSRNGGVLYQGASLKKYVRNAFYKFYPEIVYENFRNYFSELNLRVFSDIIERLSLKNSKHADKARDNKFVRELLSRDKVLKALLWENYRNYSTYFRENISKSFFLNLRLSDNIKNIDDLNEYNRKIASRKDGGEVKQNILIRRLMELDNKLALLNKSKNYLFKSIVSHPGFEKLVELSNEDFKSYVNIWLAGYIKSLKLNENPKTQSELKSVYVDEKDREIAYFDKGYPLGDSLRAYVKVKTDDEKIMIFLESPGHILGQKIFGVKLVKEISEKALLMIEQDAPKGKQYRLLARFKPSYNTEFNSTGFYFEIFKHEKLLYLKSFDEYCQIKKYIKLSDLDKMHLDVAVHPVADKNDKTRMVKKLLKPFEYSIPVSI